MKSYTQCRNLYGKLTKNTSTTNLSHGDELINDEYRHLCSMGDFGFLHRTRTQSTIAGTQFQSFPYDVDVVESVSVTVSTKRYTPELIHTREEWDDLNLTSYTSDIPIKAFVFNGQLGIWPTPASNGNTITINAKIRVIDLSIADITSSTITTLTNGSTGLTVSGGLTTQMAGFWIRPTFSTTANTGDGQWYELSSVTNSTTGTLVRAYGGTSIAAGTAACTIAQIPILPEEFHDTPVYKAAATYWYEEGDTTRGDKYMEKYKSDVAVLLTQKLATVSDPVLDEGIYGGMDMINPNLTISL